jgi:hypothetical protein
MEHLVRVTDQDMRYGLPCFIFLARSDMSAVDELQPWALTLVAKDTLGQPLFDI